MKISICKKCKTEVTNKYDVPTTCPGCGEIEPMQEDIELGDNELLKILIEIKAAIESEELIPNPDLFRTPSNYVRVLNLLTKINRAVYSSEDQVDIKS